MLQLLKRCISHRPKFSRSDDCLQPPDVPLGARRSCAQEPCLAGTARLPSDFLPCTRQNHQAACTRYSPATQGTPEDFPLSLLERRRKSKTLGSTTVLLRIYYSCVASSYYPLLVKDRDRNWNMYTIYCYECMSMVGRYASEAPVAYKACNANNFRLTRKLFQQPTLSTQADILQQMESHQYDLIGQ